MQLTLKEKNLSYSDGYATLETVWEYDDRSATTTMTIQTDVVLDTPALEVGIELARVQAMVFFQRTADAPTPREIL